jgi:hypothetical protein
MVCNSLQISSYQKSIQCLLSDLRLFVHPSHEHDKSLIAHAVDDVIHFQNGLSQLGFAFDEGFESAPHHRTHGGGHASYINGQLDGWQFDQIHDPLGDVDRLIAYALEVGIDLGHREDEAEIGCRRLLGGEDVEGHFIDLALGGVDEALVFEDELAAREIAFGVGLGGAIDRQFRKTAHAEQLLAEVLHLLLKTSAH